MKTQFPQFTPTQWDSAADKLRFANQFVKFAERGFRRADFPKWFYNRLSLTFGHIAHYNHEGFWDTWFTSTRRIVDFLYSTRNYGVCGDPAWTYSDVERALQAWLLKSGLSDQWTQRFNQEREAVERTELARLQEKYQPASV